MDARSTVLQQSTSVCLYYDRHSVSGSSLQIHGKIAYHFMTEEYCRHPSLFGHTVYMPNTSFTMTAY